MRPSHDRVVVLLCGPPGAGKTTVARQSGLDVYDADDPQWRDRKDFAGALRRVAADPSARAVVIRAGATSSARRKTAALIGATHTYLLTGDPKVLAGRVSIRHRDGWRREIAGIAAWFARFDATDGIAPFPGWDRIEDDMRRRADIEGKYGAKHRKTRAEWKPIVEAGGVACARCGKPLDAAGPWDLGHDDTGGYSGPEHVGCNRSAGGKNAAAVTHARARMTVYEW